MNRQNSGQYLMRLGAALLVGLNVALVLPSQAEKTPMPYPEFKTASGFSRFVQGVSGFTPISGWLANRLLRKELAKFVKGHLHSRLRLYSGSDLLAGKARGITITGRDVLLDGFIPLSEFRLESVKDEPVYISKGRRPILLKPLHLKASARMTEADVNRMLTSEQGRNMLTNMKVSIPPFGPQYLDVLNPVVSLADDRLTVQTLINTHGRPAENALPVTVSGHLTAQNARLNLSDLDLQIDGYADTEEIEQLVEVYFSELVDLNHIKVDRHKVKVRIEQSEIRDRQLDLRATVEVEPKRKNLEKYLMKQGQKAEPH